ncbi:MAG: hypothetical protein LLG14_17445 [Nocardiaceae bacterium]|nr:hypothetical protein [Nocardiaceae bacterium]
MSDTDHAITHTLGSALPPDFTQLTSADLTELDAMLNNVLSQREAALRAAVETSISHAPKLMRPTIRRALGL